MTMKLGSETGSVFNHLMSATPAGPVVGEGATIRDPERQRNGISRRLSDGTLVRIEKETRP